MSTHPFHSLPPISSVLRFPQGPTHGTPGAPGVPIFGQFPSSVPFRPNIQIDPAHIFLPQDDGNYAAPILPPCAPTPVLPPCTPTLPARSPSPDLPARTPSPVLPPRVQKVGGACQKKAVQKRKEDATLDPDAQASKRGRPSGSSNFSEADIKALFCVMKTIKPMSERGWKSVEIGYNKYAQEHGRRERIAKSLETKYKSYLKKGKPTGEGECPPEIDAAFELEALINERAGTQDVNDSEFDPVDSDSRSAGHRSNVILISSDDDEVKTAHVKKHAAGRRTQVPSGITIMEKIVNSLDPSYQRQSSRTDGSLVTVQLLALTQQLRDTQKTTESLRSENAKLSRRLAQSEHERQRLELKLELFGLVEDDPHYVRIRKKCRTQRRQAVQGPSGSNVVLSLTDTDTLSSDDPNKENIPRTRPLSKIRQKPIKIEDAEAPARLPFHDISNGPELPPASTAFLSSH